MSKYKYRFRIEKINLHEKHFKNDGSGKKFLKDKEFMSPIDKLIGFPISIILKDSEEFLNEGTFFAKSQAEDKASELIATLMGMTFGGSQQHLPNYIEDVDLHGRFVQCQLESIDQVE